MNNLNFNYIDNLSNEILINIIENFGDGGDFTSFALTQKKYLPLVEDVFNRLGKDLAENDAFQAYIRAYYQNKKRSEVVVFKHQVIAFYKQAQAHAYNKEPFDLILWVIHQRQSVIRHIKQQKILGRFVFAKAIFQKLEIPNEYSKKDPLKQRKKIQEKHITKIWTRIENHIEKNMSKELPPLSFRKSDNIFMIPDEIKKLEKLTQLTMLQFWGITLSQISPNILELSTIKVLNFQGCKIMDFPTNLHLTDTMAIALDGCTITATLDDGLALIRKGSPINPNSTLPRNKLAEI